MKSRTEKNNMGNNLREKSQRRLLSEVPKDKKKSQQLKSEKASSQEQERESSGEDTCLVWLTRVWSLAHQTVPWTPLGVISECKIGATLQHRQVWPQNNNKNKASQQREQQCAKASHRVAGVGKAVRTEQGPLWRWQLDVITLEELSIERGKC